MAEFPKKVKLRDGSDVMIRPLEKDDYDNLFEFFHNLPEKDRLFLKDDVTNPETIKGWFKEFDPDKVFPIVAHRGDKIVADGTLHRARHGWSKHVGEIRLVVSSEYQSKGLGMKMLDELIHAAMQKGVKKLMAQVAGNQSQVISAFEKYGFIREATLKDHIIDITGMKSDLVIMTRNIDDLIKKIEDLIISSGLSME
ncbi:GNAT family N-acetyltransferase [bacterium]|nr:GNAT family N-acetyltransferase [bacterium]